MTVEAEDDLTQTELELLQESYKEAFLIKKVLSGQFPFPNCGMTNSV